MRRQLRVARAAHGRQVAAPARTTSRTGRCRRPARPTTSPRMNLPSITTTSVGIGSALPACANVDSNCGTTHTSSTATDTTATSTSSDG